MNVNVDPKPTTCRYSPDQQEQAVRMVFALREELGTSQGTVKRLADQHRDSDGDGLVWGVAPICAS